MLVKKLKKDLLTGTKDTLLIGAGVLSASVGLECFLVPNGLLDGGVTGVSLLISRLAGWNLSILIFVINFPFILMGVK